MSNLPEKWYCLYANREEFNTANKFYKGHWGYIPAGSGYGFTNREKCNHWWSSGDTYLPGYVEITFKQWKASVEEFVLPERWCIKLTKENFDVLNGWRTDTGLLEPKHIGLYLHTPMCDKTGYSCIRIQDGYEEITFTHFKTHVLNSQKSIIMEYPQKWAAKACKEVGAYIDKFSDMPASERLSPGEYGLTRYKYLVWPSYDGSHIFEEVLEGYTEITFEEFLQIANKDKGFDIPEFWWVHVDTNEEDAALTAYINKTFKQKLNDSTSMTGFYYANFTNANGNYHSSQHKPTRGKEITFDQFKKYILNETPKTSKVETFPEFWQIRRDPSNYIVINEWMNEHHSSTHNRYSDSYGLVNNKNQNKSIDQHLPEITFEQFKIHVLKQTKMEKQIIGYKLIKPEFVDAVNQIVHHRSVTEMLTWMEDRPKGTYFDLLKSAGVLDIWFEPIYSNPYKVGDWVEILGTGSETGDYLDSKVRSGARTGDIVEIEAITPKGGQATASDPRYYGKNWNLRGKDIRLVTQEERDAVVIKEAIKRYPVGTRFYPVHLGKATPGEFCVVVNQRFEKRANTLYSLCDDGSVYADGYDKHGNISYNRTIYEDGKWAEIVPAAPVVVIKGYTAQFNDDGSVAFGCQTYSKKFITKLDEMLTTNGFSFQCAGEVKILAKYLNESKKD